MKSRRILSRRTTALLGLGILFSSVTIPALASEPHASSSYVPVKGISVQLKDSFNSLSDAQVALKINQVATYVKSLDANAISLNFPFSMTSTTSNDPHASSVTPSPSRLEFMIHLIRGYGLNVQVRPSLDETGFPAGMWRGKIAPTNVPVWFAAYSTFLIPYLEAAKQAGASEFVVGVELSSMLPYPDQWTRIIQTARSIFGPNIQYSQSHNTISDLPGTKMGWDFYTAIPPSYVSSGVTVANLQTGMQAVLSNPMKDNTTQGFPFPVPLQNTTLEEVGDPATANGYLIPTQTAARIPAGTPLVRSVQTNWFTAACNIMWANHMRGMYYWALYLPDFTPGENDSSDYLLWSGTTSETAIKTCFERTS
jgi:hypothetical protein